MGWICVVGGSLVIFTFEDNMKLVFGGNNWTATIIFANPLACATKQLITMLGVFEWREATSTLKQWLQICYKKTEINYLQVPVL